MEINIRAIRQRAADNPVLGRYDSIAAILTGSGKATLTDAIQWIAELCGELNVPGLRNHGIAETIFQTWSRRPQRPAA